MFEAGFIELLVRMGYQRELDFPIFKTNSKAYGAFLETAKIRNEIL